jgi:uncharacterized protein (DUF1330 family)
MPVYAVAQISIHDRERYEKYVSRFMEVLTSYDGRLLVADENVEVFEGEWNRDKFIMVSFADRAAFDRWAGSPEYQGIAVDRIESTDGVVLVVNGIGS